MKSKLLITLTMLALAITGPVLVPSSVTYAACKDTASKTEVIESIGQAGQGECNDSGVDKLVHAIVSILSYVVGVVAIIMIVYSGFKYITSGGDSGKVSAAKNALIYALIGLIVAALAQLMVRFVLTNAINATDGCSSGYQRNASNDCVKTP